MPDSPVTVAVTGAAGQIGYALLFRIASGQAFGPDTPVGLQLLELEAALPALDGVRMELEDCAFPLLLDGVTHLRHRRGIRGRELGAAGRRGAAQGGDGAQGSARASTVASSPARAPRSRATPPTDCRVLVVGNPCNTNALIGSTAAARHGMARDRWFAMTMLDENRGRSQLAARAGVHGPRGDAIWRSGATTPRPSSPTHGTRRIGGRPAPEVIGDEEWLRGEFIANVQQRGAAIIKARGQSSARPAPRTRSSTPSARSPDRPASSSAPRFPAPATGGYGVPEGLVFGYPLRARTRRRRDRPGHRA